MYLRFVGSSSGTGEFPSPINGCSEHKYRYIPLNTYINIHKVHHTAALLVPVWRVNEGSAGCLAMDRLLRPLVRRRPPS